MQRTFTAYSVFTKRTYEVGVLNSCESGDAFEMARIPMKITHFRILFAIKKIDGTPQEFPIKSEAQARKRLENIPEPDMNMLSQRYDKEFAIDEKDLGNESPPDEPPESLST